MSSLVGIQGHGHGIDVIILKRPRIVILAGRACESIDSMGIDANNQNERVRVSRVAYIAIARARVSTKHIRVGGERTLPFRIIVLCTTLYPNLMLLTSVLSYSLLTSSL